MLRTMLADRFAMTFHTVKREIGVYALVIGKSGFKLKPLTGDVRPSCEMRGDYFTATEGLDGISACSRSYADRPVVDMTGIEGVYRIELYWTRDSPTKDDPAFWAALESKTGLKRESRKLLRDVMVVDHLNRAPTPD
jgi:uncharacterized protein (TIGR03435 family)